MNLNLFFLDLIMHKLITGIIYPAQNLDDGTSIVFADAQNHLPTIWGSTFHKIIKKSTNDKWINNGFTNKNISKTNVDKIMKDTKWINNLHTFNPCYNISNKNSFIFNI
jgi:murein endopeptidase